MKKVMIGLIGCSLLAVAMARPQNSGRHSAASPRAAIDTTLQTPEHTVISRDTVVSTKPDTSFRYHSSDTTVKITDSVISLSDDAPASPASNAPVAKTD